MANDIMIDMETLSTQPNCVILTIGAVRFDPLGTGVAEKLEIRPTIDEQTEEFNRDIDPETLEWWGNQSEDAINEAMGDQGRVPFKDAMDQLYKFCWNRRAIWSNGAIFDIVIAENAFKQLEVPNPWRFWAVRDCRTIYDLCNVSLKDGQAVTSHKAVEDAEHQAIVVQRAYQKLKQAGLK